MLMSSLACCQDQVFTQFFSVPLQLNPALTGTTFGPRISLNYRNQWPAYPNAYVTYSGSYDQYVEPLSSGFGIYAMSDLAGDGIYKTNSIHLSYAYNLRISDEFALRAGFQGGIIQRRVDWDRLVFLDQLDPIFGPTDPANNPFPTNENRPDNLNKVLLDLNAGLLAYSEMFYVGVAIHHINAPDEGFLDVDNSFATLPIRMTVHGGAEVKFGDQPRFGRGPFVSPNFLFTKQGNFWQANVGAYANGGMFFGGLWYRHSGSNGDAAIALGGIQRGMLKIGYSYDYTISGLASRTGGSHEVSLVLNWDNSEAFQKKRFSKRYLSCPKMFL